MLESLILSEFTEKDYIIFSQQILDFELEPAELKKALSRIINTKSKSLTDKFSLLVNEGKINLLEMTFKRAYKRYKTNKALRFMLFEQEEMGE